MNLTIAQTSRPLLGEIVEVPEGIAAPTVYVQQYRKEMETRVGRIIEVLPTLITVQFFGYPHPWDYSMREANTFTLAKP